MTDPTAAAPSRASSFEDYVDVFFNPSAVFERRREASPWPTVLIVSGLFAVATYIGLSLLGPVVEAEIVRGAMLNPQVGPEQVDTIKRFSRIMMLVGGVFTVPLTVLVSGVLLWLVGKLLDAEQSLRAAFLVVAFSFLPRVLEQLVTALQAFVIDVNAVGAMSRISLSPARFLDPTATTPVILGLLTRLSPFVIWSYIILAVGLRVTGRTTGAKAAVAAIILWLVGAVPAMLGALRGGG